MVIEEGGNSQSYSTQNLFADARSSVDAVPSVRTAVDATALTYPAINAENLSGDVDYDNYSSLIAAAKVSGVEDMGTHYFLRTYSDAETRLDRFRECFQPVPWRPQQPPRWSAASLPDFPLIEMVSEAFQLNFWQHTIFEETARHLLYAYSMDINSAASEAMYPPGFANESYRLKKQLVAYLGGEAGTGKSTVVHALLRFAEKWGRAGSIETLAFTGVAAININGRTMHSARNLKVHGSDQNLNPSAEMRDRFSPVILVIIDEISMTDQALLGRTDAASRQISTQQLEFMGGRHTLLLGDWLQLPSVAGSPCFAEPTMQSSRMRFAGYALYSAINTVVFLTKNMRAKYDPVYTSILSELRWGRLSDIHRATLNTRVQLTERPTSANTAGLMSSYYRPIVVATNSLRCAINRDMTLQIARQLRTPVYECIAAAAARSRLILQRIVNLNDDLTDRIPIKLLFYIGMSIMVTRKHPQLLQADLIANGVLGSIVGFDPPEEILGIDETVIDGAVVRKLHQQPRLLLIRIKGMDKELVKGFPRGVIGIPPLHAQLRLTKLPNLSQASITVDQFPVVPAFACTTEKLQGQTCHDGIVVTPLDYRRAIPPQSLYVALSRCVSLEKLTLTSKITREYMKHFQPSQQVADEMRRLIRKVVLPLYIQPDELTAFDEWKRRQLL